MSADVQKLCKVSKDGRQLQQIYEASLHDDEDAPMTLALDRPVRKPFATA